MKKANKILAIILMLISNQISAIQVDSLKIIPPNPTSTDVVKVICYSEFSSTPCNLDTFSIAINNFEISISAEHTLGLATAICLSVDTLTIGVLPTGEYNLTYYLMNKNNQFVYDTAYLNFEISENTRISNYKVTSQPISIYPNPASGELFINSKSEWNYNIEIFDVLGKKAYNNSFIKSLKVDISKMPSGVYFVKCVNTTYNYQLITKVIIH